MPQPPQLLLSNWVSMQVPLQRLVPKAQAQVPLSQTPLGQKLPQAPQLFGSNCVSVH